MAAALELAQVRVGQLREGGELAERQVRLAALLAQIPAKRVQLYFYDCTIDGEPRPLLGQELRWVSASELASLPVPEADAGLVALLTRT